MRSLVVSLGGNAFLPLGKVGTIEEQFSITRATMSFVGDLVAQGRKVVITHGNGPVVGNIVIRNEAAKDRIPPMPLDICGADSQGGIGYMIQQTLRNELKRRWLGTEVLTVVTQVIVDANDPAFKNPTKPIGPFYTEEEASKIKKEKGWTIVNDSGRGLRRVVASPKPLEIVEKEAIRNLYLAGFVVVAVGGGGIPVVRENDGRLSGVEAVIDKDLTSGLLGLELGVEGMLIVTAVPRVSINFGKENQRGLPSMKLSEAKEYLKQGEFPAGSMGPKIEAAISFLEGGGKEVVITSPEKLSSALEGGEGTHISS